MTTPLPGDILLVRDYDGPKKMDILGELIMAGERARYGDSQYAVWTHSALVVNSSGDLVEALAGGVARSNLSKYNGKEVLIISPPIAADDPRRAFAVAFAESHVGDAYGNVDFVSLALSLLTGWKLSFHTDSTFICSELCARATESMSGSAGGYPFPVEQMMPGDLARFWNAIPAEPLPSLSFVGRLLDKVRSLAKGLF